MDRRRYLLKNTVIFAIGNLSTKLVSFLLVPLYTYVLSKSEYGTIDLIYTICMIVIPMVTLNISESILRFSLDKNPDHYQILSIEFLAIIFGASIGLLIVPYISVFSLVSDHALLLYLYIVTSSTCTITVYYLRGREQLVSYSVCNILNTLVVCVLNIYFLVYLRKGLVGYFNSYIIAYSITTVVAIITGKQYKVIKHFQYNKCLCFNMIKFSIALLPNSLLWWVTNSFSRVIISKMISTSANGLYSVSCKIPSLLWTFSMIFIQAWSYSAVKEKDSKDRDEFHNYMYNVFFRFLILVAGGLLVTLKPLLRVFVAPIYYDSWKYSPFLILGFVFMITSSFIGTSYYVNKNSVKSMLSNLFGTIINIILNLFSIPILGLNGASIATCISGICIFLYRVYDTKNDIRLDVFKKDYIILILIMAGMCFTIYWSSSLGYIILIIEYIIVLILNRNFVGEAVKNVMKLLNLSVKNLVLPDKVN